MDILSNDMTFVTTLVDDIMVNSHNLELHAQHVNHHDKLTEVNLILNPNATLHSDRFYFYSYYRSSKGHFPGSTQSEQHWDHGLFRVLARIYNASLE